MREADMCIEAKLAYAEKLIGNAKIADLKSK